MPKTIITRPDLSEMENVRLHNMANMYINILEDEGYAHAVAYLAAELKAFTYEDISPYIQGVELERGLTNA